MATEESEDTLMVKKPKDMAVVYEAVYEAQAQNTDDIMSANNQTLEDMDQEATTAIFVHAVSQHTATLF